MDKIKINKHLFILLLVLTIVNLMSYSAAAVSDLEKKISKQNLKIYKEEYGIAELNQQKKKEVDNIFKRLSTEAHKDAPELDFRYWVIDAPVMNAAYLGDGRMILFKGLVNKTETNQQLAAILAHELGHGVNNDIEEKLDWMKTIQFGAVLADLAGDGKLNKDKSSQITAIALNLLQKGYSRTQEKAADYYSVFLTDRAGYDPYGAVEVMKLLKEKSGGSSNSELLEIFAEHPNLDKRINYLNALVTKVEAADEFYYSPISTARRFTQGLINDDFSIVYETYGQKLKDNMSLDQFKKQERAQKVRSKIDKLADKLSYQIDLRNQVEETARVAVLFNENKNSTLALALDLKKGDYGWKVANGPYFY